MPTVPDAELVSSWEEVDEAALSVKNGLQKEQLSSGVRASLDKADDAWARLYWISITRSGSSYTCDKTLAEIQSAQLAGAFVRAHLPDGFESDITNVDGGAMFYSLDNSGGPMVLMRYTVAASGVSFDSWPIGGGSGLTEEIKQALLACFDHVAWDNTDGQDYYDALQTALYSATLVSIAADYQQDRPVYADDDLDVLKVSDDLTVTANYSDGSSVVLGDDAYELSGTLTGGTSTITVSYGGKTDTISVTVKDVPSGYTRYDYIQRYSDSGTVGVPPAAQIRLKKYSNLNELSCKFAFKPLAGHVDGNAIWGRRDGTGYVNSYAFYAHTSALGYHLHGNDASGTGTRPSTIENAINIVKFTQTAQSPSSVSANDGAAISVAWANNNTLNLAPTLLTNAFDESSNSNLSFLIQDGYIQFFNLNGEMVGYYVVAVRAADNVIGMYDLVEDVFYTCSTVSNATIGNSNCKYKVGNWS
jgi:hypothetical protein